MRQFSAIIVDDEANNRENLSRLLARYCPKIEILGTAASVAEAQSLIKTTSPEVVFLDIEMPGGNGFKLLEHSTASDYKVIFVTAYDSYALKAIKFSALDYILKPIDKNELIQAVDKLDQTGDSQFSKFENLGNFLNGRTKRIALSLAEEVLLVDLDQIIRVEADSNYSTFTLMSGEAVIISKTLGYYYDLLKEQGFSRVHQSHLVNQSYLQRFVKKDGGYLVMANGDQVPVSRTQRQHITKLFSEIS